jgi:hypothetical protein
MRAVEALHSCVKDILMICILYSGFKEIILTFWVNVKSGFFFIVSIYVGLTW